MRRLAPLAALALLGCSPAPQTPPAAAPVPAPVPVAEAAPPQAAAPAAFKLAVDGEGLRLVDPASGRARPIPFGTAQAEVLAPLERQRGAAGAGTNDCGQAYAAWADGLTLTFRDGRFVGWSVDGRAEGAITDMAGVGPGAARSTLDAYADVRVSETTLGQEFTAGGLAGLLDGAGATARITNLWAGETCIAR